MLKKNDLLGIYFILKKLLSMSGVTRYASKLECFMNGTYTLDFRRTLRKGERQEPSQKRSGAGGHVSPTLAQASRDLLPASGSVGNGAGLAPPSRFAVEITVIEWGGNVRSPCLTLPFDRWEN